MSNSAQNPAGVGEYISHTSQDEVRLGSAETVPNTSYNTACRPDLASVDQPAASATAQERINCRLYQRVDLVRSYSTRTLSPPEATVLVRYRDDIVGRRVLDLGCGAGRLTAHLRPLTNHYVGLDFSPFMVDYCRRHFPGLQFMHGDMRRLSELSVGMFHTIFAIDNLFDAVGHDERLHVLAAVRQLLVPGGLLIFSAHNRNWRELGDGPRLEFSRNPLRQLRQIVLYFQRRRNRRRIKPHQRFETDYALVNDSAHNYSVLHYYINRDSQVKQLADSGFCLLECLDEAGLQLKPGDDNTAHSSIHYVARSADSSAKQN